MLARGVDVALVGFERIMLRAIARAQPPSPATAAASEASSDATIDDLPLLVEGSHEVEAASNGWGIGRESRGGRTRHAPRQPSLPLGR